MRSASDRASGTRVRIKVTAEGSGAALPAPWLPAGFGAAIDARLLHFGLVFMTGAKRVRR